MGLTRDVGRFIAAMNYDVVPKAAVPVVVTGFTDCVGVTLAGLAEPVASIVANWAGFHGPLAQIADLSAPIPAPELALVLGTAAHALDYDDTAFSGHPSAVLVPAVLAEAREVDADGKAMAAAYLTGYEIWGELSNREPDALHQKGWHPSAMFGTIAAAGVSAKLRGLNEEMAMRAVGIAASLASGVVANFGSMTKPFHLGRTAQSGLVATRLAEAGLTSSADALEHDLGFLRAISPQRAVDTARPSRLGETWSILSEGINVKLYPVCFGAHRIIDAMRDLRASAGIGPDDIVAVDAFVSQNSTKVLRNSRPQTDLEAKFSAQFAVAAAAINGRCGSEEVNTDFVRRPDVQALMDKVTVHPLSEGTSDNPTRSPFDWVEVTLADGRRMSSPKIDYMRGHFKRGVERDVLWQKFSDCAAAMFDADQTRRLFETLQALPAVRSVRDFHAPIAHAAE